MSVGYLCRRILYTLILVFIVATMNFFLPRIVPGDPAARFYEDPRLSPEAKQEIKAQFGLDKSMGEQFLVYLKRLFKGDMGISFTYRRPVMEIILGRIPWTVVLTGAAFMVSVIFGVVLGAFSAWRRGGFLDSTLLASAIAISALPTFWFALLLILFLAFYFPLFPPYGMVDFRVELGLNWESIKSVARHAFLPVLSMSFGGIVSYGVLVRNAMIEITGMDYIRTARAKGLAERKILFRHAFRNALLPLVTKLVLNISGLVGGAVIIETIFSWEGMGLLIVEASRALDYPLMQGTMLILALMTIMGNFAADVVYLKLDPRIRYE